MQDIVGECEQATRILARENEVSKVAEC